MYKKGRKSLQMWQNINNWEIEIKLIAELFFIFYYKIDFFKINSCGKKNSERSDPMLQGTVSRLMGYFWTFLFFFFHSEGKNTQRKTIIIFLKFIRCKP